MKTTQLFSLAVLKMKTKQWAGFQICKVLFIDCNAPLESEFVESTDQLDHESDQ